MNVFGNFEFKAATTLRGAVAAAGLAMLSACGVSYSSQSVESGDDDAAPVTVVPLTLDTAATANRAKYSPRSLPDVFYSVAGGGSGLRAAGAIPPAPLTLQQKREAIQAKIPAQIQPAPYRIGVGDVVLLATRGTASTVEQLTGLLAAQNQRQGYTVRDDGTIAIPEVGTVELANMTLPQAEDALFQRLVENQIDPSFSLEVSEFNSQRVAVGGAVHKGALLPLTLQPLTLGEALASAGGLAVPDEEFGVIRIYRDGTIYQIPVEAYLSDSSMHGLNMQSGDAVYVDTTYDLERAHEYYKQQIDVITLRGAARGAALTALTAEVNLQRTALQERRQVFLARTELGAIDRDYVYLTGEVRQQSRVPLPFEQHATLADVLYGEGGFDNTTGDPTQIYVLRSAKSADKITAYHLDVENAANIVIATRLQMRPNDVVFIEEQPITKWGRSLQQIFPVLLSGAATAIN